MPSMLVCHTFGFDAEHMQTVSVGRCLISCLYSLPPMNDNDVDVYLPLMPFYFDFQTVDVVVEIILTCKLSERQ